MSSLLSIRLSEDLLTGIRTNAALLHVTQTDYVRQAITNMNHETEKQMRIKKLQAASLRVREESMKVNTEFSEIEHDPEA